MLWSDFLSECEISLYVWYVDGSLLFTHTISLFLLQFCHISFWEFSADEAAEYL